MNLLPEAYIKQLAEEKKFRRIMAYNAIIFLSIILFVIIQLIQIAGMSEEKAAIAESLKSEKYILSEEFYKNYTTLQTEAEELKKGLSLIPDDLMDGKSIFLSLLSNLPEGCFFEELNISGDTVYFSGCANRKEDILGFSEKLPDELSAAVLESLEKRDDGSFAFRFSWRRARI